DIEDVPPPTPAQCRGAEFLNVAKLPSQFDAMRCARDFTRLRPERRALAQRSAAHGQCTFEIIRNGMPEDVRQAIHCDRPTRRAARAGRPARRPPAAQTIAMPPLTCSVWPVTQLASSLAR